MWSSVMTRNKGKETISIDFKQAYFLYHFVGET